MIEEYHVTTNHHVSTTHDTETGEFKNKYKFQTTVRFVFEDKTLPAHRNGGISDPITNKRFRE